VLDSSLEPDRGAERRAFFEAIPMPKLGIFVAALFLTCSSTGRALEAPEPSSLVFWPVPLTAGTPSAQSTFAPEERPARGSGAVEASRGRSVALAQTDTQAEIDKQLALLGAAESQNGERAPAALDPLLSLAELYRARGDQTAASAALEQAIHIFRVNSGLYALDQAGAVESLIASKEAAGQDDEAATLRDYLHELVWRNTDDPRATDVLTRLADDEMAAARRLLDEPPIPEIEVRSEVAAAGPRAPLIRSPALKALLAARRHYNEAIRIGNRNGNQSIGESFALEDRLVDTVYFELVHPELRYYEDGLHQAPQLVRSIGLKVLKAKVANSEAFQRSNVDVARALIELGDWYLIFADNGVALDQYQQAYDLLLKEDVPQDAIAALVSPPIPELLPAAERLPDEPDRTPRGYVDVAVTLGRFGTATDVELLAASPGTARTTERRLQQYINRSRFRPRFVDGQLARSDRFTARFYYDY
jgi:hypothetical protein